VGRKTRFIVRLTLIAVIAFAFAVNAAAQDSIAVEQKISEWMKNFKKNNKAQIYRCTTKDSTVVFGSNKAKTFLTSVMILTRKEK
jgi:hypothetical protein